MTDEYQGGVEVFVVLLDVVHVVLGGLLLVHGVEVESGVFVLDWLKEGSESILDTESFPQRSAMGTISMIASQTHHFGSIRKGGDSFSLLSPSLASSMSRRAYTGAVG